MFKLILLLATLFLCVLSGFDIFILGGKKVLEASDIESFAGLEEMRRVDNFAREEFNKKNSNNKLEILLKVQEGLAAGSEYSMTYRTEKGNLYEVAVFEQSWTQTTKLMRITKLN